MVTVADTAFSIAVVRAEEGERPAEERLFEDPYAHWFAAAGAHAAEATQRYLDLPFLRDGVRLRTRLIDDEVRAALRDGIDQVVLLGAGFDARGLRMPEIAEAKAKVYEIDTADQLARKRAILEAAGVAIPERIAFVPFAFDGEAEIARFEELLTEALVAHGFRRGGGAIVVWEGVIGYIDSPAIERSLRFMVHAGGVGTRVVFTFGAQAFGYGPPTETLKKAGFTTCADWGMDEIWPRYLPGKAWEHASLQRMGVARV